MRRAEVVRLSAQGLSQRDIAAKLGCAASTINADIKFLRQQARDTIQDQIDNVLPYQHTLAISGLDQIIKEAWAIYHSERDAKTKLAALSTISNAIMSKQAVLGDPAQIERAIQTVSQLKAVIKSGEEPRQSVVDNSSTEPTETAQESEPAATEETKA